jgi:hypothetical protein
MSHVLWGHIRKRRVLRGGSFINNHRNARCANRNRNQPDNRNRNNGFRVVASTFCSGVNSGNAVWRSRPLRRRGKWRNVFPAARTKPQRVFNGHAKTIAGVRETLWI